MAVPSLPFSDKAALRREARARRKAFVAAHSGVSWTPGATDFEQWFDRGVEYASYRPMGSEADPAPIERIAAGGHNMCRSYPRVDADGVMHFYAPTQVGFVRDSMGIEAPAADAQKVIPSIIFVPLLAFDRSGTRLGQGAGHYDRALETLRQEVAGRWPIRVIGVAWSVQEFADLPRDPWDVPLDAIITEREWTVPSP